MTWHYYLGSWISFGRRITASYSDRYAKPEQTCASLSSSTLTSSKFTQKRKGGLNISFFQNLIQESLVFKETDRKNLEALSISTIHHQWRAGGLCRVCWAAWAWTEWSGVEGGALVLFLKLLFLRLPRNSSALNMNTAPTSQFFIFFLLIFGSRSKISLFFFFFFCHLSCSSFCNLGFACFHLIPSLWILDVCLMGFFCFFFVSWARCDWILCVDHGVIEFCVLIDPREIFFFFFFSGVTLILIITEKLYKTRILVSDGYDKVRPPPWKRCSGVPLLLPSFCLDGLHVLNSLLGVIYRVSVISFWQTFLVQFAVTTQFPSYSLKQGGHLYGIQRETDIWTFFQLTLLLIRYRKYVNMLQHSCLLRAHTHTYILHTYL